MSEVEQIPGVETPAPDAESLPTDIQEAEIESESSTDDVQEPKQPKGVQKRLNELTANWREEQRRAERLERMLEQSIGTRQTPEPTAPAQPQGEPKLEQFATYEEFVDARADYRADLKIRAWEESRTQKEQAQAEASRAASFQSRVETFREKTPDFDEVALNPRLPVSDAMATVINSLDNGPEVLYQLGQNPTEAARIAALSPTMAAVEIGRFVALASIPQPKRQTSAPAPIEPLGGGPGATMANPLGPDDPAEWLRWRNQQLGRK
jgi:hypothetical protein